jgi:hypothetical protein
MMKPVLLMRVTYRSYKRAWTFYLFFGLLVFDNIHIVTFDALVNKLLSTVHLKYFNAYTP